MHYLYFVTSSSVELQTSIQKLIGYVWLNLN